MRALASIIFVVVLLSGCGAKHDPTPAPPPVPPSPGKSVLLFPAQNSACTTGTIVSDSESTVEFSWNDATNADSYELDIKNLLTADIIKKTSSSSSIKVTLARGTPFSWYIVARSAKTTVTATSDTWKFYNAGPGVAYYTPFPAELTAPAYDKLVTAVGGAIDLAWNGSSIDNNIVGYDVYLSTSPTPALLKGNITDSFLKSVAVSAGTMYYWKVVTKDAHGNTSDSGVGQFKVK